MHSAQNINIISLQAAIFCLCPAACFFYSALHPGVLRRAERNADAPGPGCFIICPGITAGFFYLTAADNIILYLKTWYFTRKKFYP
ncbi:MAG: hypothetical protein A2096_00175 [Spirochaetes bacterium GWF1_41_5]|nr:MAG: hypothetical protein A2096_00175 [Spirochaetes bacterium GWF1_41_5]HBE03697.1 hypothetical protein [Spirochaetia bacterium]